MGFIDACIGNCFDCGNALIKKSLFMWLCASFNYSLKKIKMMAQYNHCFNFC